MKKKVKERFNAKRGEIIKKGCAFIRRCCELTDEERDSILLDLRN